MHLENTWPVKSAKEKEDEKRHPSCRTLAHEDTTDIMQAAAHKAASDSFTQVSYPRFY